ncbi:hypothetical protein FSP39_019987, partial [Pinctada imbricata]
DSWTETGDKDRDLNSANDERIYSGHSSPQKQVRSQQPPPSAGTLDSYNDNAFHRKPPSATVNGQDDDFFDS